MVPSLVSSTRYEDTSRKKIADTVEQVSDPSNLAPYVAYIFNIVKHTLIIDGNVASSYVFFDLRAWVLGFIDFIVLYLYCHESGFEVRSR